MSQRRTAPLALDSRRHAVSAVRRRRPPRATRHVVRLALALVTLVLAWVVGPRSAAASATVADGAAATAAPGTVQTIRVGVALEKLAKFELAAGSYSAEFILTFTCPAEPCAPDFDVTNGKVTGKEKIVDDKLEKIFRVKTELEAYVDLAEFPFDRHVLPIGLVDKGDPLHVRYAVDPGETGIDPAVKLAGWEINPAFAVHVEPHKLDANHEVHELTFGIAIARPRVAAMFKTLVPVFFMIFVAGFTLLLKPKSAAGRLSATTAGLMTVVMFHLSSTSSLPPLGYLTRMDKFMIATYVVYLVNIAFAVAIVRLEEKKNEVLAELAYLAAGGAVPGVALLAWITVFLKIA